MAKQTLHNITLGVFVLTGLLALILAFYFIGSNRNLFGGNFKLKTRFGNLNGLQTGNNVLYAGMQAGTVKKLEMINDSTVEATLLMDEEIAGHIHKNALAAIGSEGLMGNKVVSLTPVGGKSPLVASGDRLTAREVISTDEMLQTLAISNRNIAEISGSLRSTVVHIGDSRLLRLLDDPTVAGNIKVTIRKARMAADGTQQFISDLNNLAGNLKAVKVWPACY